MAPPFLRLNEAVSAVYPVPDEDLPDLGEDHTFNTMAIWNRKGGVAKTTITHALGFAYALKGKRVLMVDADTQCDLSFLLLKEWIKNHQNHSENKNGELDYDKFFNHKVHGRPHMKNNLKDALAPVVQFAGGGGPLGQWGPADVTKIPLPDECDGALFLLPGHEDVVDYEKKVTVAYGTNLMVEAAAPGAWNKLIALTARKCGADIVLIDCNPHRGKLNMHIVLTSDYLFLPCAPDTYSYYAIKALPAIMNAWVTTRHNARNTATHAGLAPDVQIPAGNPRILGVSVMRFTQMRSQPARNFQLWMDRIEDRLLTISGEMHVDPAMAGMAGTPGQPGTWPSILVKVPDFNQLAAMSHFHGVPVIALGPNLLVTWHEENGKLRKIAGKQKKALVAKVLSFQRIFRSFLENVGSKAGDGALVVAFVDNAHTSGDEKEDDSGSPSTPTQPTNANLGGSSAGRGSAGKAGKGKGAGKGAGPAQGTPDSIADRRGGKEKGTGRGRVGRAD